jgi:hypothetical protein
MARMARLNEVAASASSSSQLRKPTRMNGRLTTSATMPGRSNSMSNQA